MTKCTLCVDRIYDELLPPQGPQAGLREGLSDRRAPVRRRQDRTRRCRRRSASVAATS